MKKESGITREGKGQEQVLRRKRKGWFGKRYGDGIGWCEKKKSLSRTKQDLEVCSSLTAK